jgi:hypothetical protein
VWSLGAPEWQTAIACLIGTAEGRDFLVHARIGMLRALTGTSNACSILRASIITGEAGSRRAIDDQTADGEFSLRHLLHAAKSVPTSFDEVFRVRSNDAAVSKWEQMFYSWAITSNA